MDAAKIMEKKSKPKHKFIKKAALEIKKEKPKVKSMAERALNMYGKKKGK